MGMKLLIIFISGFLFHKAILETINYRRYSSFVDCIKESNYPKDCYHNLEFTKLDSILLYQPDLWELYK